MPETVYHSLALDNGGSIARVSVLVRLISNESKSPTAFSEGKVRLPESSGYLEDDGWRGSSASSTGTIAGVVPEGPRVLSSLRCLPIVGPDDPPAAILFWD